MQTTNIILLVGESCSGKDTIAKMLEKDGFRTLKSYTTRPRRKNEGDTHIFISPQDVAKYTPVAYTKIGNYEYFATKEQIEKSDVYIIDPDGVKFLESNMKNLKPIIFYINVGEEERLRRAKERGDTAEQIIKRFAAEKEQFAEFKADAKFDYAVKNDIATVAGEIIKDIIFRKILSGENVNPNLLFPTVYGGEM